MNGWLLAAGSTAAATTVIHVVAGGRSIVRPLPVGVLAFIGTV